jgi:hypothetical protein
MTADFGIGAQVHLRDASAADPSPWPNQPSAIIVRAGGSALNSVWGRNGGGRMWWIEFDEPQPDSAGDGPFPAAMVHEKYLELAPPVTADD